MRRWILSILDKPWLQNPLAGTGQPLRILRAVGIFLLLTLRKSREDAILLTAFALAFVTMLALVPLLAAFSFIGARVFDQYEERTLEIFVQILPYSEQTIVEKIQEFLGQTESLQGYGLVALFITTLFAFATVEETFNNIWNVSRVRPLRVRLLSFTMLLFWGPLAIGATFSSLLLLRRTLGGQLPVVSLPLGQILPFVLTLVGLTMLYWLVPYTTVRFRHALLGGVLAAALLEGLRQGFTIYVQLFPRLNVVYGSFAFALLFMMSVQIAWTIVLAGSAAAYVAQNFQSLSRGPRHPSVLPGSWIGLVAVTLMARRFAAGEAVSFHEALAGDLCLRGDDLARVLEPLLSNGLLREVEGGQRGYILGKDPRRISVNEVLGVYDPHCERLLASLEAEVSERLKALRTRFTTARSQRLEGMTVADLLEQEGEPPEDR